MSKFLIIILIITVCHLHTSERPAISPSWQNSSSTVEEIIFPQNVAREF